MMTAPEKTNVACPSREDLRSFSVGNTPDAEGELIFQHIAECPTCQSEMETLDDGEDSLIAGLRVGSESSDVESESQCQLAVAKALGALASAHECAPTFSDFPKVIGEYELIRPLGRGGMGNVFLAKHTKLGREVALKVIADHRLSDPRVRERFENEMQAVGRLSHPNIVTAYDAREIDTTAVLVTEYIDGLDLTQVVNRVGPLPVAEACEIARLVAVALQYTSDQGFVHRDVKPSNIMLSRTGETKLLDLGLARLQDNDDRPEMTGTGQTMGTADYVSPEQVTDSRNVDVRSDLYSLGCTLFKLLCGQTPFATQKHASAFAKMNAHVSEAPPKLSAICADAPKELCKLVQQLLAKDPADRPSRPLDVASQLTKFAGDADLVTVIDNAITQPENASQSKARSDNASPQPATAPWWRKPVTTAVAIGAGFFGFAFGMLLMGILLLIELPDGTKIKQVLPDAAKVTMSQTDDAPKPKKPGADPKREKVSISTQALGTYEAEVEMPGYEMSENMAAAIPNVDEAWPILAVDDSDLPRGAERKIQRSFQKQMKREAKSPNPVGQRTTMMLAIVTETDKTPKPINKMGVTIGGSDTITVIKDPDGPGLWYPVDESVDGEDQFASGENVNFWEEPDAQLTRVLFSPNQPGDVFTWRDIKEHFTLFQNSNQLVTIRLNDEGAKKMLAFTTKHLNKRLAVIVNDRVVAAPHILSPASDEFVFTGVNFGGRTIATQAEMQAAINERARQAKQAEAANEQ